MGGKLDQGVCILKRGGDGNPLTNYGGGLFQKNKQTGVEEMLFEKTPGNFRFLTLPLKISDKKKVHPWKLQNCVIPLGNFKA